MITCNAYILAIDVHAIDNCAMAGHIAHELPVRTLPDLHVIGSPAGKSVLLGVENHGSDGLLVIGQSFNASSHR